MWSKVLLAVSDAKLYWPFPNTEMQNLMMTLVCAQPEEEHLAIKAQ